MSKEPLLQVKDVTKVYGYGFLGRVKFPAVDHVSLSIEDKPEIFTIAGESGCGKTTLARMILSMVKPTSGTILYRGKNVHNLKSRDRTWFLREVQAIFQDPFDTFNPLKKVDTYLYETGKNLLKLNSNEEIHRQIEETLRFTGLSPEEIVGKYPSEFSGGQIQRISIARALLPKPRLIIADEPVSMVDASIRMNILNMFKDLLTRTGTSFIYITHDLATAYYISDEIAIMYRGMIVETGPAEKVLLEQRHPYTEALVKSLPEPGKKEEWKTRINAPGMEIKEFLSPGCKYADICPHKTGKCVKERPPLFELGDVKVACWLYKSKR